MRALVLTSLIATLLARAAAAQATVDLAKFTPPSGWQRSEQNGVVSFLTTGNAGGRPIYCQIFFFPSHPTASDVQKNFSAEWSRLIAQPFAVNAQPQLETRTEPGGWSVITGYANAVQRGIPVMAILVTGVGAKRSMSVVVNVTSGDYVQDVRDFLAGLHFGDRPLPPPTARNTSNAPSTGSLDDYVYTIPGGWTHTVYPDGIVYASPMLETGERCQFTVFQMRPASSDLLADARRAYAGIFQIDPFQDNAYPFPTATLTRGVGAAGWNYLVIQKSIHGHVGDGTLLGTRLFAAQLGDRDAIITTTGKDPEVSQCFGVLVRDEWPRLFYSLAFRNWTAVRQDSLAARRLAGTWTTATASVADRYTFAANGRFASAAAAMTVTRISPTELLQTTNAYFGDGSYKISGNTITLTSDHDRAHPQRGFFRIEAETQDGNTWQDRLCLLLEGIGEVCYKRE